jgi:hypothetical protein
MKRRAALAASMGGVMILGAETAQAGNAAFVRIAAGTFVYSGAAVDIHCPVCAVRAGRK